MIEGRFEDELREKALAEANRGDLPLEMVMERAEAFLKFLKGEPETND